MLLICRRCTTRYAVGLPYCPQCTSTEHYREGEEEMPKITKHGGSSIWEGQEAHGDHLSDHGRDDPDSAVPDHGPTTSGVEGTADSGEFASDKPVGAADESGSPAAAADSDVVRPRPGDRKEEWVNYVTFVYDIARADAEAMTKDELIQYADKMAPGSTTNPTTGLAEGGI